MDALFFLIPLAAAIGAAFAALFLFAVRSGQFDDLDDPAQRILEDDD